MPSFRAFGRQLQLRSRNQRNTRHRSREKADFILGLQRPDLGADLPPVPRGAEPTPAQEETVFLRLNLLDGITTRA